jgi:hypothetical protein
MPTTIVDPERVVASPPGADRTMSTGQWALVAHRAPIEPGTRADSPPLSRVPTTRREAPSLAQSSAWVAVAWMMSVATSSSGWHAATSERAWSSTSSGVASPPMSPLRRVSLAWARTTRRPTRRTAASSAALRSVASECSEPSNPTTTAPFVVLVCSSGVGRIGCLRGMTGASPPSSDCGPPVARAQGPPSGDSP